MSFAKSSRLKYFCLTMAVFCALAVVLANAPDTEDLVIRGQRQALHLYGPADGEAVVVSSGDGGWVHLAPHVAETLAARGFFVVGFDVKAYLESFTSSAGALRPEDEPADYRQLVDRAARATHRKPTLIGVSEGAGLSVLAASDPNLHTLITGVVGLGLPNLNELAWRWKDSVIYVTHALPREPTFSTAAIVNRIDPVPLAAIHSTRDEFVPVSEVQEILNRATGPKRLWIVPASNHRFSDNLGEFDTRLIEAIDWVKHCSTR
jgi:fermentation-respiration switch protein FrsA (DUF1100 family)